MSKKTGMSMKEKADHMEAIIAEFDEQYREDIILGTSAYLIGNYGVGIDFFGPGEKKIASIGLKFGTTTEQARQAVAETVAGFSAEVMASLSLDVLNTPEWA